jgi:hypothetical protein
MNIKKDEEEKEIHHNWADVFWNAADWAGLILLILVLLKCCESCGR